MRRKPVDQISMSIFIRSSHVVKLYSFYNVLGSNSSFIPGLWNSCILINARERIKSIGRSFFSETKRSLYLRYSVILLFNRRLTAHISGLGELNVKVSRGNPHGSQDCQPSQLVSVLDPRGLEVRGDGDRPSAAVPLLRGHHGRHHRHPHGRALHLRVRRPGHHHQNVPGPVGMPVGGRSTVTAGR